MKVDLKGLFSPSQIASALERMPPLETTIMDILFPGRPMHPRAVIGMADLLPYTGTVPVVRRNGRPVRIPADQLDTMLIAPRPIKAFVDVNAADLNDMREIMGDKAALQAWQGQKIDQLRRVIRATTEAMASVVATTGKLSWPSALAGGAVETFEIDFGEIGTHTPGKLWSAADASIIHVRDDLVKMARVLSHAGFGGKIEFMAGETAFSQLLRIANTWVSTAVGSPINVKIEQNTIIVGGYKVSCMDEQYQAPGTGTWTNKLAATALLAYAVSANGSVTYAALDSISANLKALPFHVVVKESDDDTGITLIGMSKPLPARHSKSSCIATVSAA